MITIVSSWGDILKLLCKSAKQWGLYIAYGDQEWKEVKEAAPYLKGLDGKADAQLMLDESAYFLFDDEQEMRKYYEQTVGDDGSETNPYKGKVRVYACICDPIGMILTENT